jgi:uncharacterized protein
MKIIPKPIQFEWNQGNAGKSWIKHNISDKECEEPFFDPKQKVVEDVHHSEKENRYLLFGKTKQNQLLIIAFTIRHNRVRIISARIINKKEKAIYEKTT